MKLNRAMIAALAIGCCAPWTLARQTASLLPHGTIDAISASD